MKILTHDSSFHTDDIFAVAVLLLVFPGSEVIRSRDQKQIDSADYTVDVGMVNDPKRNRFDHHMFGGAGERENHIPYASFGLVWKEFGEKLAGGKREADIIDRKLIQSIDAYDNGVATSEEKFEGVRSYTIGDFFNSYMISIGSDDEVLYEIFMNNVSIAKDLLVREIQRAKETVIGEDVVINRYHESKDKRLVELPREGLPWETLADFTEPLFVIYPRRNGSWGLKSVPDMSKSFGHNRKSLPENWAGKKDNELQEVTGVPDALFTHNKRFMASAGSKEGILALAKIALDA